MMVVLLLHNGRVGPLIIVIKQLIYCTCCGGRRLAFICLGQASTQAAIYKCVVDKYLPDFDSVFLIELTTAVTFLSRQSCYIDTSYLILI